MYYLLDIMHIISTLGYVIMYVLYTTHVFYHDLRILTGTIIHYNNRQVDTVTWHRVLVSSPGFIHNLHQTGRHGYMAPSYWLALRGLNITFIYIKCRPFSSVGQSVVLITRMSWVRPPQWPMYFGGKYQNIVFIGTGKYTLQVTLIKVSKVSSLSTVKQTFDMRITLTK